MSSSSLPLFENSCLEMLKRLEGDPSAAAEVLRREAQGHLDTLLSWKASAPSGEQRSHTATAVMDLYRKVLEHTTSKS